MLPILAGGQTANNAHVHRSQVANRYRHLFESLGDRLEVKGKERLVLNGTLVQAGRKASSQTSQIVVALGGMLRVDNGSDRDSAVFDGKQLQDSGGAAGKADQDLVDALVQDSMETFLVTRANGGTIRDIATQARIADPQNPGQKVYCDVYQVVDQNKGSWRAPLQVKSYSFDSTTHLLRSVVYIDTSAGKTTIETRYTNWHPIEAKGQMVPGKIERFENGVSVLAFTIQSAVLMPDVVDNTFKRP